MLHVSRNVLLLAVLAAVFSSLSQSFKTPFTTRFTSKSCSVNSKSFTNTLTNQQQRNKNMAVSAYQDIQKLNDAIKLDGSKAYEMLKAQKGKINMETVHLTITALAVKGAYDSIDDVMFLMRSEYEMESDGMMWEIIIVEAAKQSAVIGKKYYNRMLKHGPPVPSIKAYEILFKSLSRAENWKEVAQVYTDLVKRPDIMESVNTGFYEMLMSFNSKRGRWKETQFWMSEMKRRNLVQSHKCHRFLIDACQKGGKQQLALQYIDVMLEAFKEEGSIDEEQT